jgi:ATP synthase I chain
VQAPPPTVSTGDLVAVPAVARKNLRRSTIMAAGFGLVGLLATWLFGHPLMGLFLCVGMALGVLNSYLVQRSVLSFGASVAPNKKARFARSVLGRLMLVTVLALGCALLTRPDGLGAMAGLALFQMIMIGGATVPVLRDLRSSS